VPDQDASEVVEEVERMADKKTDDPTGGSFQDVADFMQRMWNPLGVPMPGFGMAGAPVSPGFGPAFTAPAAGMPFPNPAAMFATLDPAEVDRKIAELRIVEGWLQMSLNMMQLSIKTLELQKASLEALRGAASPGQGSAPPRQT
jgi:hypothetical protein